MEKCICKSDEEGKHDSYDSCEVVLKQNLTVRETHWVELMVDDTSPHVKRTCNRCKSHNVLALTILEDCIVLPANQSKHKVNSKVKSGHQMRKNIHALVMYITA